MNDNEIRLDLIDCGGLDYRTRQFIERVWGYGKWVPATLGDYSGELYQTEDKANVFATIMKVNKDLRGERVELIYPKENETISGIVFGVSNDGGKTGVAWRDNVFDAFKYLDLQNVNGGNYAVVAVRKQ